ncbi:MAG: polyprenyl synthetase family protein [Microgenomates group bacterium]
MKFSHYLTSYINSAKPLLDDFFEEQKNEAEKISPLAGEMIDYYRNFMEGGKMIRGMLTKLGYEIAGGKEEEKILWVSLYPEIIHSFLLIHDDIMDEDEIRRGKPTAHLYYAFLGRKKYHLKDASHYGLSMAIDLGDLGNYLAGEALLKSNFPPEKILALIKLANRIFLDTAFGQALDITGEAKKNWSKNYILKIFLFKTARYSVVGPLQFGAVLANANKKFLNAFKNYGEAVGIAFQIQDDILGMFGEEEIVGKDTGKRDIKEGKLTLLIEEAQKRASPEQKLFLKRVYGKRDISSKEVKEVKEIIINTGALEYCQKYAQKLVEKGKKFIPQITPLKDFQEVLETFADFVIERKK